MSFVPGSLYTTTPAYNNAQLYYLLDASLPSGTGSYTVAVTFAGAVNEAEVGAVSLTGVSQAGPLSKRGPFPPVKTLISSEHSRCKANFAFFP